MVSLRYHTISFDLAVYPGQPVADEFHNVILPSVEGGVEISAIDPVASMAAIDNDALKAVAGQVGDMLIAAVKSL